DQLPQLHFQRTPRSRVRLASGTGLGRKRHNVLAPLPGRLQAAPLRYRPGHHINFLPERNRPRSAKKMKLIADLQLRLPRPLSKKEEKNEVEIGRNRSK